MTIFKRQTHVLVIMGHIGFVVHDQKFPKSHVLHLCTVLGIMPEQQRKSQYLMELCRANQVSCQQCDDNLSLHIANIQNIRKDVDSLPF